MGMQPFLCVEYFSLLKYSTAFLISCNFSVFLKKQVFYEYYHVIDISSFTSSLVLFFISIFCLIAREETSKNILERGGAGKETMAQEDDLGGLGACLASKSHGLIPWHFTVP